ncbi:MAG TPA: hypothetical protein VKA08_01005 [Balneolales bacterium]|nr:hypothetical protein [Balneolales bacterium]
MMYVNTPIKKSAPKNRNKQSGQSAGVNAKSRYQQGKGGVFSPDTGNNAISYAREPEKKRKVPEFSNIKPWKVIVGSILFGVVGLFYLNHVFYTQKLLSQVTQLQKKYEQTQRIYNDRKFTYDKMIGPTEIYSKARKLGMITGGPNDHVIIINH